MHVLVIPKMHIESIKDLEENNKELLFHLFQKINEVAKKKVGVYESGFRVITNAGKRRWSSCTTFAFSYIRRRNFTNKIKYISLQ